MRSFFNKPAWATKTDDSSPEFYRRAGQTFSDIVAANREARKKEKLAAKFSETASSASAEEGRQHKRPRKSDEHEERSATEETEDKKPETTSAKSDEESKPNEHARRLSSPLSGENGEAQIIEVREDESRSASIPRPIIQLDSTENQSTDRSSSLTSRRIPDSEPPKIQEVQQRPDSDTKENDDSHHSSRHSSSGVNSQPTQTSSTPPPVDDPRVHILITSEIPNTKPLIIQRKLSQTLKDPRLAWCKRQGFTDEEMSNIYLTWKGHRVFDVASCKTLGIKVEKQSFLGIDDDPDAEQPELQVHMEAVSRDPLMMNRRGPSPEVVEASPAPPVQGDSAEAPPMRLVLRSPGLGDFKVKARAKTLVSNAIAAFRMKQNIPADKTVHLVFDGDRLDPGSCFGDYDIADLDMLEVLIK